MLHVIGPALVPTPTPHGAEVQPGAFVQSLMFTSADGTELTGKTLLIDGKGYITVAAGSVATNNQRTLMKSFNGTDSAAGWETILDTREA